MITIYSIVNEEFTYLRNFRKNKKITLFNDMFSIFALLILYVAFKKVGIISSLNICIKIIAIDFILKLLFCLFALLIKLFG